MINWSETNQQLGINQNNVKWNEKVYVRCEKCNQNRLQHYSIAKQNQQHICMSCIKTKETIYSEIDQELSRKINPKLHVGYPIIAICSSCKNKVQVTFRRFLFKNSFKCGPCRIKEKWMRGDYEVPSPHFTPEMREKIANKVAENWKKQVYRNNWSVSIAKSKVRRSEYSKKMWSDPQKCIQLSQKIKNLFALRSSYYEKVMAARKNEEYRRKMSETIRLLWSDFNHRNKIELLYQNPELIRKFSSNAKQLWTNPEYRKLYQTVEWALKSTEINKKRWADPVQRARLMEIFHSEAHLKKMATIRLNQPKTSTQQYILYSLLNDLKVKYYKDNDEQCKVGYYCFDCRINRQLGINLKKDLFIEVQGDYWHNLPKAVARDKSKSTYLRTYFPQYDLKYLWEHEFDNKDRIRTLLRYWLGMNKLLLKEFDFRNIVEKITDYQVAELFIAKYHYAGKLGRSGLNLGYYLNDELIAVIIYANPIRQEVAVKQNYSYKEVLELSRLAIHPEYQIKNLASHLISRSVNYVKLFKPEIKLLVSFADSTYNHSGTIYKAANWRFDGEVSPDYWYADDKGHICHKRTLWGKAKKFNMTESVYCKRYNYLKVWGDKKLRFKYIISPNARDVIKDRWPEQNLNNLISC